MKIMRLWRARDAYKNEKGVYELCGSGSLQARVTSGVVKRRNVDALPGRGRKRMMWADTVHADLRTEVGRLRRLGVRFNLQTLRAFPLHIFNTSSNKAYPAGMMHPDIEITITSKITFC